jgi:hypothetical protein
MTWHDIPDKRTPVPAHRRFAAELNAFVVAQADRQWMHRPKAEPMIYPGPFGPLYRYFELGYSALSLPTSRRRCHVQGFLDRVGTCDFSARSKLQIYSGVRSEA